MDIKLSRRRFFKKSAAVLGAAAVYDLIEILGVEGGSTFKALASEGLEVNNMAHIGIKLFPGRSEQVKQRLADAIVEDIVRIIGCGEESVSVSVEDVSSGDWKKQVYDPEIQGN